MRTGGGAVASRTGTIDPRMARLRSVLDLMAWQPVQSGCRLPSASAPPRQSGTLWSISVAAVSCRPQAVQRNPVEAHTARMAVVAHFLRRLRFGARIRSATATAPRTRGSGRLPG